MTVLEVPARSLSAFHEVGREVGLHDSSLSTHPRANLPALECMLNYRTAERGTHSYHGFVNGVDGESAGFASLIATHQDFSTKVRGVEGFSVITQAVTSGNRPAGVAVLSESDAVRAYHIDFGTYRAKGRNAVEHRSAVMAETTSYCMAALLHGWVVTQIQEAPDSIAIERGVRGLLIEIGSPERRAQVSGRPIKAEYSIHTEEGELRINLAPISREERPAYVLKCSRLGADRHGINETSLSELAIPFANGEAARLLHLVAAQCLDETESLTAARDLVEGLVDGLQSGR